MQTFSGLALLVVLAICYMFYFHTQPQSGDGTSDGLAPVAVTTVRNSAGVTRTSGPHSVYKADLDRAHAAARQIQQTHAEADSAY